MRVAIFLSVFLVSSQTAAIPATPLMTLYQFNGPLEMDYYSIDAFQRSGPSSPAGSLAQGTSVIPCLVIRNGQPLMDAQGTPYVGFQVVVDSRTATSASAEEFKRRFAERAAMSVRNHHCDPSVRYVINVRDLYVLNKAPFFEPPRSGKAAQSAAEDPSDSSRIVRAFHNSEDCADANRSLMGRRGALARAWESFIRRNQGRWPSSALDRAKHLDYTLRTTIFEGHLQRGCNAYGACERNIIALSIRNRGRGRCSSSQGCRGEGDFQSVSSAVSQYNIWDEYLTQISGLTSCFLRDDLVGNPHAENQRKYRAMYEQSVADVERILFGEERDLAAVFPGKELNTLTHVRHYYHAPAMGKCFPNHERVEYLSGAVARRGSDFVLIANTRVRLDGRADGGYYFREFRFKEEPDRDTVTIVDNFPGFVLDERKVILRPASGCLAYGVPSGCPFREIGRYRKTPNWLNDGQPVAVTCRINDRGAQCTGTAAPATVEVGGRCDTEMRPVAGVR